MLDEYPRPQMVRRRWLNLCGLWDYAFTDTAAVPTAWDGQIQVPLSPEAPASGVGRTLQPGEFLWYHRTEDRLPRIDGGRLLLHFGAVDQTAVVWCNGQEVGHHAGGFTPFTVDITDAMAGHDIAQLVVCVQDATEQSLMARGRQCLKSGGMWHTAQSGIWQPVWAEPVPAEYIRSLKITPLYDEGMVEIIAEPGGVVHFDGEDYPSPARVPVPHFIPWTPENPRLYNFTVTLGEDSVESYFAMRKFSLSGRRLCLNNRTYFMNGVLDQGRNPHGLYTWMSDQDMVRDITLAKKLGFNTLRKHLKVEPLRWYYHCDRLGMIVWQDMPNGGGKYSPIVSMFPVVGRRRISDVGHTRLFHGDDLDKKRFVGELREMIQALYNCPCIALWTLFNEGWGQFEAARLTAEVRRLDPTRLIDHASGWSDQGAGDIKSIHHTFRKFRYKDDEPNRAITVSQCGGYICSISGHLWDDDNYTYSGTVDSEGAPGLERKLRKLYRNELIPGRRDGLSAAILHQLTDVEDEFNGLVTCDRAVVKIPPETMREIMGV